MSFTSILCTAHIYVLCTIAVLTYATYILIITHTHIRHRRGDFQYKEVKLSASAIWHNLHYPNGTAIIPDNSFVYIATDDPDGVCEACLFQKRPCDSYGTPKPVGCPEDVS